jgi:hypothetical protein
MSGRRNLWKFDTTFEVFQYYILANQQIMRLFGSGRRPGAKTGGKDRGQRPGAKTRGRDRGNSSYLNAITLINFLK